MKKLFILLIILQTQALFSQSKYGNTLSNEKYLQNPSLYLTTINSNKLETSCLLDRSLYPKLIMDLNGVDRVRVINCADWAKVQNAIRIGEGEKSNIFTVKETKQIIKNIKNDDRTYSIGIIDYVAEYLSENLAINPYKENFELNNLIDSLKKIRIVASSIIAHNITGDKLNFIVPSDLFFTNIKNDQELISIEMDFNNGNGFIPVSLDQKFSVDFKSSKSDYYELIIRLKYKNSNGGVKSYYSHCSIHRTGTSTVPMPENPQTFIFRSEPTPLVHTCYPSNYDCQIKYSIVYHPDRVGWKLRRPFIVTDGFDPGNKRDYYENDIDYDSDLPMNYDTRGLYQLVNGDPSHWETETTPNFISELQDNGFDFVFIDFIAGAGDIPTNVELVRDFLNDVINSSAYRDNKTEESILVGPSMGGLITRYALKTMEDNDEEHFVKTWVAFDSPMEGAYIPIGLQEAVEYLADITFPPALADVAQIAQDKLNSDAARQLLVEHFDPDAEDEHEDFYDLMHSLDYPDFVKRYTITCGGEEELYTASSSSYEILHFAPPHPSPTPEVKGWALRNDNNSNSYKILRVWEPLAIIDTYHSFNIGYDGSPGGYNTALYSFNAHPDNRFEKDPALVANTRWMKASFIPTTSAMGIEMDDSNILDTWDEFSTYPNTPFDEIIGMEENEAHVNISQTTANSVISNFENDFDDGLIPYSRSGQNLNKSISAPVAFTYKNSIHFGGNGNTVIFKDGADVNVKATDYIRLGEGVSINPKNS